MLDSLSENQKEIVFNTTGKLVVRACPGSGKTYTVAARLIHRISNWQHSHKGIAVLSFTNVAWKEIEKNIIKNTNKNISYPHYLGTLDSFLNQNVFLPFGHLVMNCKKRPILVGEPYGQWSIFRWAKDYDQYFDKVSFGVNEQLIYPKQTNIFFFNYNQFINKNGTESKYAKNIIEVKNKYWLQGYATQRDANYFSMKLLEKFPIIARSLIQRFPEVLIDEAQDTSEIQMKILDILINFGLNEILLVGDPDQAIYEWNDAKPSLFNDKYQEWKSNSIQLNENRRSSQVICNTTFNLSSLSNPSLSINPEVSNFNFKPIICTYNENNIPQIIDGFIKLCTSNQIDITPNNIAILFRSSNFKLKILGLKSFEDNSKYWEPGYINSKDVVKSKFMLDTNQIVEALGIFEKVCYREKRNLPGCNIENIADWYGKKGFTTLRKELYNSIKRLPKSDTTIGEWILQAKRNNLKCTQEAKDVPIINLFSKHNIFDDLTYTMDTVHSIKGETFDATLLFLNKMGLGKHYKTLVKENVSIENNEELRIVYVGITRPRKILMIAVPDEVNKEVWENKLKL